MISIRPAGERGHFDHGWLDTYHTFSFGDYHDSAYMGFRALRVINEDRVAPATGFGKHGHRDMEIVTYVLQGAIEHRDSTGGSGVLRPGEVQRMTAGRGVFHSEVNPSKSEPLHLLQIWLLPEERGLEPGYEQKSFAPAALANRLGLVVSREGRDGSLSIHQDVDLYAARLARGATVRHAFGAERHGWVQIARGSVGIDGVTLTAGDGASIADERDVVIEAREKGAELLLFDLG